MGILSLFGIAVALAMDAFAVALSAGAALEKLTFRRVFRLGFHFGLFQALMPVIGWLGGVTVKEHIESFDHWIAFILLAFVGLNMVKNAFSDEEEEEEKDQCDPTRGMTMVMLSIATSIDALAVGLSMAVIGIDIFYPALVIGLVAGVFTVSGMFIGRKIGKFMGNKVELLGGVILIVIGLKILSEHNVF